MHGWHKKNKAKQIVRSTPSLMNLQLGGAVNPSGGASYEAHARLSRREGVLARGEGGHLAKEQAGISLHVRWSRMALASYE